MLAVSPIRNGSISALVESVREQSLNFLLPLPEGNTRFPPFDPAVTHLLIAQAHIPPTELLRNL
jgi:hypothetical protein